MAALSSQLTSEGKLSKTAQTIINQNSNSAPASPKFHRPSAGNSQRAAAMAALSFMLGPKAGPISAVSGERHAFYLIHTQGQILGSLDYAGDVCLLL